MRSRTILLAASLLCVAALAPAQQPRKVQITDVKVGQGQPVKNGDLLLVEYTGTFKNGKQFDSNAKPDGTPFALRLGAGNVIRGWDEGLVGMRVGGVRKLMIPWEKAYGSTGTDRIPPKTDLYFTVKLLDAVRAGEERVYDKRDLKVGTGAVAKDGKPGSKVTIHYVGKLVNGRVFDDSQQRNVPAVFTIGSTTSASSSTGACSTTPTSATCRRCLRSARARCCAPSRRRSSACAWAASDGSAFPPSSRSARTAAARSCHRTAWSSTRWNS